MRWDPSESVTTCRGCGTTIEGWLDYCDQCEEMEELRKRKPNTDPKTLDEVIDELNRLIVLKRYELNHDLYLDDAHKYTEAGKISALEGALFLLRRLKQNQKAEREG